MSVAIVRAIGNHWYGRVCNSRTMICADHYTGSIWFVLRSISMRVVIGAVESAGDSSAWVVGFIIWVYNMGLYYGFIIGPGGIA